MLISPYPYPEKLPDLITHKHKDHSRESSCGCQPFPDSILIDRQIAPPARLAACAPPLANLDEGSRLRSRFSKMGTA
ncbi:hypothetical protein CEXT_3501 [Caerostris extrusa]|uniref:Uncharacterized protein n=1 Tax=Caerostris extrusa TaxID=172846 RepID=A0AAV4QF84_CAEEX|nr:hypothetical protein CEXT_3501 [Caerostris extrusa]